MADSPKEYMGDGVWVVTDDGSIEIFEAAEKNGVIVDTTEHIIIKPEVLKNIIEYATRMKLI